MSTPASAGSATLSATPIVIFDATKNGGPCAAFTVVNRDSANDIQISVNGIHVDGSFATIAPGGSMTFGLGGKNYGSITKVAAKATVGSPIVNWSVAGQR